MWKVVLRERLRTEREREREIKISRVKEEYTHIYDAFYTLILFHFYIYILLYTEFCVTHTPGGGGGGEGGRAAPSWYVP